MKKRKTQRKIIVILLIVSICLSGNLVEFSSLTQQIAKALAEENYITMTEYYNEGNYGITVPADRYVTVNSPQEFLLFRQCITDNKETSWVSNPLNDIRFLQTQDIHFADFTA